MSRSILVFFSLMLVLVGATAWLRSGPPIRNGIWQARLERADGKEIAFNFEVKDSAGSKILYLINSSERLLVDKVFQTGDSITFQLPFFDSYIIAALDQHGVLNGRYVKRLAGSDQIMPFVALYNSDERFSATKSPQYNVTGSWEARFIGRDGSASPAIGEFVQQGALVSGTFRSPGGDYRYLQGIVSGDSLKLSTFDGGHAYLFLARIDNDQTISSGKFYAGPTASENWNAKRNAEAILPDGYQVSKAKNPDEKLNFRFRSTDNQWVSIQDPKYKGKVVVIQILGSWCPNCMDETSFLSKYYIANRQRGVEVIGLAYERTTDFERSRKSLQSFQQRFNLQYPVLITGVAVSDSLLTEKSLPQIDKIAVFPTSIFIDKNGKVAKIYAGYDGPATGIHYQEFTEEFESTVDSLLKQ
jgi:thiol-disulfide isomerase/thioredoxin